MTSRFSQFPASILCAVALSATSPTASPQATLGQLLDAGARRMSGQEFSSEIVGRAIQGPLPAGGELEVLYTATGGIVGWGSNPNFPGDQNNPLGRVPIDGEWKIDDGERVCTTMQLFVSAGRAQSFPARCQYWFRLADAYFLADSDVDRRAKVLRRTIKK